MGQELECRMQYGKRSLAGKAHLETDFLLFRGEERVKVAFRDLTSVEATGGVLRLEFAGGPIELELGQAAQKWAEKILHPPSRLDKLGVKAGSTVRLVGEFGADFVDELRERGALIAEEKIVGILFFAAATRQDLGKVKKLAAAAGALWVIYPKGGGAIREVEVIEAGRAAGLKDVKVVGFSATHTGLKFVAPGSGSK